MRANDASCKTIYTAERTFIQECLSNTPYFDVTLPNPRLQLLEQKRKNVNISSRNSNVELTITKNPSLEEWKIYPQQSGNVNLHKKC